jgi:predicted ATP-grasp superfamily ATP-dependent carboligase
MATPEALAPPHAPPAGVGRPEPLTGDGVLVLDAEQRTALAVIRSLGRRGLRVVAGSESVRSLGAASRFCTEALVYPSPEREPARFLAVLQEAVRARRCGVVLPTTDATARALASPAALRGARIPIPDLESLEALNDKWSLYRLARAQGIPVPRTERLDPADLARGSVGAFPYPVVLKPVRSRTADGDRWVKGQIHHLTGADDLRRALARDPLLRQIPYLVQERIPGRGHGVSALADRGRPLAFFAHRRLREKPPWGGVSVLSESVPVPRSLLDIVSRLLRAVPWHGVAMVEFKLTANDTPYLIEVNPRFWGSLQLAIDAGVDFPWLLYQLAVSGEVEAPAGYRSGVRCRWLLGDLDALYLTLRSPRPLGERLRAAAEFFRPAPGRTRHEVNRLDDLRPFLHELRDYLRALGG